MSAPAGGRVHAPAATIHTPFWAAVLWPANSTRSPATRVTPSMVWLPDSEATFAAATARTGPLLLIPAAACSTCVSVQPRVAASWGWVGSAMLAARNPPWSARASGSVARAVTGMLAVAALAGSALTQVVPFQNRTVSSAVS